MLNYFIYRIYLFIYLSIYLFFLHRWLKQVSRVVSDDNPQGDEAVSWSAYHAGFQPSNGVSDSCLTNTALLPLFYEQTHSVAMIRHSMDVVKKAVDILNPGQVPIITVDQPLLTIAKQIQWNWTESHGEDQLVIMFGGLHIEIAAFKTIGNLLESSGWTGALVQANVASPGTADSFLRAAHATRTQRAHQKTASSLYHLLQKAYTDYCTGLGEEDDPLSIEDWCSSNAELYPQFKFWLLILQLELTVLLFVRAIREADFKLYRALVLCFRPHTLCSVDPCSSAGHGNTERRTSRSFCRVP